MGQAIGATEGLAVHLEAGPGLLGLGRAGPLLEAGILGAGN